MTTSSQRSGCGVEWPDEGNVLQSPNKQAVLLESIFPNEPIHNLVLRIGCRERISVEKVRAGLERLAAEVPALQGRYEVEILAGDEAAFTGSPLVLSRGPLLRAGIVQPDHNGYILLVIHESAVGRSQLHRLFERFVTLYGAQEAAEPLTNVDSENISLEPWISQLRDAPALDLPFDHPRRKVRTFAMGRHSFKVPAQTVESLCRVAERQGAWLQTVFLAAFKILIHRYTGATRLTVASETASRSGQAPWSCGPVPLHSHLDGSRSFVEVLGTVQRSLEEAEARGNAAIGALVPSLGLDSEVSRPPLCQIAFEMLRCPSAGDANRSNSRFTLEGSTRAAAKYDLEMIIEEGAGGVLEYNSELFDVATIEAMAGHYVTLLESLSGQPAVPIAKLQILTTSEKQRILCEWNATEAEYPAHTGIHELFEEQVARTPDAVALVFEEAEFTYRQLNERANAMAARLREMGVGVECRVGICIRRSPEMLMSQLAVLKAGGAYVPLDPTYPADRLAFMADDAALTVLITESKLKSLFQIAESKVVEIDNFNWAASATEESAAVTSDTAAYVIYTSGSTGKPKGVIVTHGNAANFFVGMDRVIGTNPGVWLAVTSICFDISVLELFWTLSRGFKVVLQGEQLRAKGRDYSIPSQAKRWGVTHFQCTPSLAGILLQEPGGLAAMQSMKKILLGGEALPAVVAEKLQEHVELINVYGPTETTVWSAATVVKKGEPLTIGRPIANTSIYVLDTNLEPVPAGIPGEIYIGGEGVARGYLNRPELTAEKFIKNPFSASTSARMYRTGDLGRFLHDGRIDYLGRADFQVKLRGFRIELGEIENALRQFETIRDAVVTVHEYSPGDKRLVAYCIPHSATPIAYQEVRRFLRERMPEYMVPSAFLTMERLPLTPNGKVDRKALPAPEAPQKADELPATLHERALAAVWQEVLGVSQISAGSDFFELKGKGVQLMRVRELIRERTQVDLPLLELFQNPSLRAQARLLAEAPCKKDAMTAEDEAFWKAQFSEPAEAVELPVDHAIATGSLQVLETEVDGGDIEKLRSLANGQLAPAMLAVYHVLIHRLTSQDETVIGVGRELLPMRLKASSVGFGQHLEKVIASYQESLAHRGGRGLDCLPQVTIAFSPEPVAFQSGLTLALAMVEEKRACKLTWTFDPGLLDSSTVVRWAGHFNNLLAHAVREPNLPIGALKLLTNEERRQLVEDWNATALEFPKRDCLHHGFERQAALSPNKAAVLCEDRTMTYAQLNARANQLARSLLKRGAGPDVLIGVWMDRTEDLVVALLGILKSGSAYLPLDAGYPAERLQFMLEDTKAPLLLTEKHWLPHLPKTDATIVCLDDESIFSEQPTNDLSETEGVRNNARHLAYVIYTSGSTGKPKGVAIEHQSATAFVHWAHQVFTPEELGGMFASTSICFDLSVFELFAPLNWGGTVVLAEHALQLPDLPARERVTLVNTVPSAAGDLLRAGGIPASVTTFALAGEPLSSRLVEQLYALPHVRKVYDLYGPSETTTYSTFTLRQPGARPTIGKPLANTQIYIVNPLLEPVPIGVPGELCIGGDGLARGYLNAPEATAQKFVPDPFRPGSRMYRTGDLARWMPDGQIEFLGRKDHQVKIRGYRIELGEIESGLASHPAVRECAATVHDTGEKTIVGYVVAEGGLTSPDLRRYLREKLPDYMVPSALVFLDAMPRTPNGKVNRRALPAPTVADHKVEAAAEALNPIEDALAQIWGDVIGVTQVQRSDNFFDLGGHSVLVVQILSRIRSAFDVDLIPRNVFEAPTLAELSRVIEEKMVEQIDQMTEEPVPA